MTQQETLGAPGQTASATAVIRLLLVEDDEEDYWLTSKLLRQSRSAVFDLTWVRNGDAALRALSGCYQVCLVDYHLGAENGLAFIKLAIASGFDVPMILLTGRGDHDIDLEAMRAGAADYLPKDQISPQLMERVIRHSMERKAVEVALRISEEQLRQSQKMEAVGSLAGGVAHDFNNLLSIILGYVELLSSGLDPKDPMRIELAEISDAGERAAALTRQLLAFSRQQVLEPRVVDLNEIFSGMESMLRRVLGEDVVLTSLAAPILSKILADPGQLEQVFMNLLVNARDAMPRGGTLTVSTKDVMLDAAYVAEHTGTATGPHVMMSVSDDGVGMDRATQARIFEPFFTTKEAGKGTGLGLAMVFGIVRQSGGTISVESEAGRGTTFTVHFPVATQPDEARVSSPSQPSRPLRGTETILLVEDDERVRVLVRTILRKYGYEVLEAQSGGDALLLCEEHGAQIDLLLTDVVMPRMSGRQLAERLLLVRKQMKVLYMSGFTNDAVVNHGVLHSTIAFIQKPITPAALAGKVRAVLDFALEENETS